MAKSKVVGILICALAVVLDITAGILGSQAEAAQNKVCYLNKYLLS